MKTKLFSLCLCSVLLVVACKNKKSNTTASKAADSLQKESPVSAKKATLQNVIDTASYDLPYWDTTMSHTRAEGYIDTFYVDGEEFRIVHQDTTFDGTVEVFNHGYWHKNIEFVNVGNNDDYNRTTDFNGDGFPDILETFKWYGQYYLYDPARKRFSDTANGEVGNEWGLIDTPKHVFYSVFEAKLMGGQVDCSIFTYKNGKREELLTAEILYDKDEDDQSVTKIIVYQNDKVKEKIKPTAKIETFNFDYRQFWKEQYAKTFH